MADRTPLANPSVMRGISNGVDNVLFPGGYKDDSQLRGAIHGVWHTGAGVITGNPAEFTRANDQFAKAGPALQALADMERFGGWR